jgi:hypothetical protein
LVNIKEPLLLHLRKNSNCGILPLLFKGVEAGQTVDHSGFNSLSLGRNKAGVALCIYRIGISIDCEHMVFVF